MSQLRLVRVALLKKPHIDHVGAQLGVESGCRKSAFPTKG
jgi:hypothetical protein